MSVCMQLIISKTKSMTLITELIEIEVTVENFVPLQANLTQQKVN